MQVHTEKATWGHRQKAVSTSQKENSWQRPAPWCVGHGLLASKTVRKYICFVRYPSVVFSYGRLVKCYTYCKNCSECFCLFWKKPLEWHCSYLFLGGTGKQYLWNICDLIFIRFISDSYKYLPLYLVSLGFIFCTNYLVIYIPR